MTRLVTPPDWYEEDVVCFAAVPIDQVVDWAPDSFEPEHAIYPPEGTFFRLQLIANDLGLSVLQVKDHMAQTRLSAAECREWLGYWEEVAEAVDGTPGAGWVAAIGLLLLRCARSSTEELLIEGP